MLQNNYKNDVFELWHVTNKPFNLLAYTKLRIKLNLTAPLSNGQSSTGLRHVSDCFSISKIFVAESIKHTIFLI